MRGEKIKVLSQEFYLLQYNAMFSNESQPTFLNILPPFPGVKSKSLVYSSTLNMEVICSSKTLAGFYWTTHQHIPKDVTFHNCDCENLELNRFLLAQISTSTDKSTNIYKKEKRTQQ
jgi:hypothetical protein